MILHLISPASLIYFLISIIQWSSNETHIWDNFLQLLVKLVKHVPSIPAHLVMSNFHRFDYVENNLLKLSSVTYQETILINVS